MNAPPNAASIGGSTRGINPVTPAEGRPVARLTSSSGNFVTKSFSRNSGIHCRGQGQGGEGVVPDDGGVHADDVHEVREGDEVGLGEERRDPPELCQVVAHARHRRRADRRRAAAPRGPLPRGDGGVGQVHAVGVRLRVPLEELALRCEVVGTGVHFLRERKGVCPWGLHASPPPVAMAVGGFQVNIASTISESLQ